MKIYHNPRCSKSRQTLAIIEENNQPVEVIKYLDDIPSKATLKKIISLLNISPIALVRKNEAIWKEEYKDKNLSEEDIIDAMHKHPKLIERPIVIKGEKAIIGRPPENVKTLF